MDGGDEVDQQDRVAKTQGDARSDNIARVAEHLWSFALDQEDLRSAADELQSYLVELARSASVKFHAIDARAKELRSYEAKAATTDSTGAPKYAEPASQIFDCIAARVIAFTAGARDDFADLIASRTTIAERVNPGLNKYNGYDSEHLIVTALNDEDARLRYPALSRYLTKYPGLEIQLRTVAAHAWAEYEHDVRYKAGAYQDLPTEDRKQIDQWFIEAGGMRRVMDSLFSDIEARLNSDDEQPQAKAADTAIATDRDDDRDQDSDVPNPMSWVLPEADPVAIDLDALEALIGVRYSASELGDRTDIEAIKRQLLAMGLRTMGQVDVALGEVEDGRVERLMDYSRGTTGVRRLDDELLAAFSQGYVNAETDPERAQLLRLRLRRVGGKFAIYSVHAGRSSSPLLTAARAVRLLASFVTAIHGPESAKVEGVVSEHPDGLDTSTRFGPVRTRDHVIYVATSLTRSVAEETMKTLIGRIPGSGVEVLRAGDILFAAPRQTTTDDDQTGSGLGSENSE